MPASCPRQPRILVAATSAGRERENLYPSLSRLPPSVSLPPSLPLPASLPPSLPLLVSPPPSLSRPPSLSLPPSLSPYLSLPPSILTRTSSWSTTSPSYGTSGLMGSYSEHPSTAMPISRLTSRTGSGRRTGSRKYFKGGAAPPVTSTPG